MSSSLEAKIVVLGAQGVGKTSLVHRYVKNTFHSPPSSIGASFLIKRVLDSTSDTIIRMQLWDTAGQERFRSISRLFYRGANACILCYDITDQRSFEEMWRWYAEFVDQCGDDQCVVHVVGTKSDVVALDPGLREVPFERTIAHVAEVLHPHPHPNRVDPSPPPPPPATAISTGSTRLSSSTLPSATSNRSSGFWGLDNLGWDCCHEISAKDGEGIDEVFRVITRKLVEQRNRREESALRKRMGERECGGKETPGEAGRSAGGGGGGGEGAGGSLGRMPGGRRSWLGLPGVEVVEGGEGREGCCM